MPRAASGFEMSRRTRPTQIRSWSEVSIGMGNRSCASSAPRSSTSLTPGAEASAARASSTVMSRSNSSVMLSECERSTGTRTQVQFTRSSGRCIILRPSFCNFISSEVKPSSLTPPICGIRLLANWAANARGSGISSPRPRAASWASSSAIPGAPAPEAAWYVETIMRFTPASLCSGQVGTRPMMVAQLGLAIRP